MRHLLRKDLRTFSEIVRSTDDGARNSHRTIRKLCRRRPEEEGEFIKSKAKNQKKRLKQLQKEYDSVVMSAVTTLTFLILLEGLLGPEFKENYGYIIVVFAVCEVILDIFVISPEMEGMEQ